MTQTQANEFAAGLHKLAAFVESRPELIPCGASHTINLFPGVERWGEIVRCGVAKKVDGGIFSLVKDFGDGVKLEWNRLREDVCTRVKVGEQIVPATEEKIVPAVPEVVIPAQPERVIEVFDWVCPDSLLKATAPQLEEPTPAQMHADVVRIRDEIQAAQLEPTHATETPGP